MLKIRDRLILGLVSGALGCIPREAVNLAAYYSGLQKVRYGEVIAGVFISKKKATSPAGVWFGIAADVVLSSLLGIPIALLLSSTGKDGAAIKGGVVALAGFGGLRGLIANTGPNKVYPRDVASNALMTVGSLTWGLSTGAIMRFLADESVFPAAKSRLVEPSEPSKTSETGYVMDAKDK